eukprot:Phypoly_transcript_16437.p1 GENE.Phypoly_transcript_16437~~Phypoly_transcript_16437.p1  ORF type:complete len:209 (+),score=20.14 Phypoly_transcript_16437:118-744(+)
MDPHLREFIIWRTAHQRARRKLNFSVFPIFHEDSAKTKWHFSLIGVTGIEIHTDPEHLQLHRSAGHSVTTWHTLEFSSPIIIPGFKERTDTLGVRFQLSRASKKKNITDQFAYFAFFNLPQQYEGLIEANVVTFMGASRHRKAKAVSVQTNKVYLLVDPASGRVTQALVTPRSIQEKEMASVLETFDPLNSFLAQHYLAKKDIEEGIE